MSQRASNRLMMLAYSVENRTEAHREPSPGQRAELEELLAINRQLERLVVALSDRLDAQGPPR